MDGNELYVNIQPQSFDAFKSYSARAEHDLIKLKVILSQPKPLKQLLGGPSIKEPLPTPASAGQHLGKWKDKNFKPEYVKGLSQSLRVEMLRLLVEQNTKHKQVGRDKIKTLKEKPSFTAKIVKSLFTEQEPSAFFP